MTANEGSTACRSKYMHCRSTSRLLKVWRPADEVQGMGFVDSFSSQFFPFFLPHRIFSRGNLRERENLKFDTGNETRDRC